MRPPTRLRSDRDGSASRGRTIRVRCTSVAVPRAASFGSVSAPTENSATQDSIMLPGIERNRAWLAGLAVSGSTAFVAVSASDKLLRVDLTTGQVTGSVAFEASSTPYQVRLAKDGPLYVALQGAAQVAEVDPKTLKITRTMVTGRHPNDLLVSGDRLVRDVRQRGRRRHLRPLHRHDRRAHQRAPVARCAAGFDAARTRDLAGQHAPLRRAERQQRRRGARRRASRTDQSARLHSDGGVSGGGRQPRRR